MDAFPPQQPDEGYSEDPLSGPTVPAFPDKADDAVRAAVLRTRLGDALSPDLARQIASMSTGQRRKLTESLLESLPTSVIVDIIEKLRPRLYIDFIRHLPAEICLKILGYLDPVSLIAVARTNRAWYRLAVDRTLWEAVYHAAGFKVVAAELRRWEEKLNRERPQPASGAAQHSHASKRRAISSSRAGVDHAGDSIMADASSPVPAGSSSSSSLFNNDPANSGSAATATSNKGKERESAKPRRPSASSEGSGDASTPTLALPPTPTAPDTDALPRSTLWIRDPVSGQKRVNWRHLYALRRRLEANWEHGRYTNFQFPHPDHPYEAHSECIYTLQFNADFLVSGSRDRTIRIWSMKTQRLVGRPLTGHRGSVLCLQFDSDAAEDLIVSGSSDASVVLWRFSTGALLQRITAAHREPVLNVRFNKQILVTCSKDRTIKVFTRLPLHPGDTGYGVPARSAGATQAAMVAQAAPAFVVDASQPVIAPYTLIGNLEGHNAAVNAVQIHGHEIVSASGDRTVKIWDWPSQTCLRTLLGHTKGIACVQYDGRRIVSGSSDNEVKVFDRATSLEIGSLRGHTSLVRTVQAGFGDEPGCDEAYREEAARVDREYRAARDSGMLGSGGRVARTAGAAAPGSASRGDIPDISYTGATLPPGGGGGRFGRIVSGSYDTTVIIWRRDRQGKWNAQHVLRHEDAAEAAALVAARQRLAGEGVNTALDVATRAGPLFLSAIHNDRLPPATTTTGGPGGADGAAVVAPAGFPPPAPPTTLDGTLVQAARAAETLRGLVMRGVAALQDALALYPQLLGWPSELQAAIDQHPSPFVRSQLRHAVSTALGGTTQAQAAQAAARPGPVGVPGPVGAAGPAGPANAGHHHHAHVHAHNGPPAAAAAAAADGDNESTPPRVFKLQFDARQIICCSQQPILVGWDFCNGDAELEEAVRFFATVE